MFRVCFFFNTTNLLNRVNLQDILCLKIRQKQLFHKIKPVNENLFAGYENTVFHLELESWNSQWVKQTVITQF